MSILAPHDLDTMNEDDVAGEIVRPFCRALGYTQGNPEANLRSQVSIQYGRAYLGHKNKAKDPVLRGRPDFVCEVVSFSRWVVEAKAPSVVLSQEDSDQAHTYATHPEIAAEFYVLTNGREFRLYRVAKPEEPIWTWKVDEVDTLLPALKGMLGPEAMKARANVIVDKGKPIAPGHKSSVSIVGGHVTYTENRLNVGPPLNIDGLVNTVSDGRVFRNAEGLIEAELRIKSSFSVMDPIFDILGLNPLKFRAAEEFLSTDPDRPTLMQNLFTVSLPPGTELPHTPLSPGGALPVGIEAECYVDALIFIQGRNARGSFSLRCEYTLSPAIPGLPRPIVLETIGSCEIALG